jgi:hypothetical protein
MGRRHFPSEVERTRMVFYIPAARAFWTGRKTPPGPLRKAKVFYFGLPPEPPGAVPMRVLRARKMLSADAHDRYRQFMQAEGLQFVDEVGLPAARQISRK